MNAETKGWVVLTASKIAKIIPYAIDIAFIFSCGGMVILGTQIFKDASKELKILVDAGELPDCLIYYPSSMMLMMMSIILLLYWMTRRK